jgi:hypothetical protein
MRYIVVFSAVFMFFGCVVEEDLTTDADVSSELEKDDEIYSDSDADDTFSDKEEDKNDNDESGPDAVENDDEMTSDDDSVTCEPNSVLRCSVPDNTKIVHCNDDGTGEVDISCKSNEVCITDDGEPQCMEKDEVKCLYARESRSYQGCEYYSVNLPTLSGRADPIFSIMIANTDEQSDAIIDISVFSDENKKVDAGQIYFCLDEVMYTIDADYDSSVCKVLDSAHGLTVPSGSVGVVMFPNRATYDVGTDTLNEDPDARVLSQSGFSRHAYHVSTSVPTTVYQFNPFDNTMMNPFTSTGYTSGGKYGNYAYSNDASILLPVASYGRDYIAASYYAADTPGFMTVVNPNDKKIRLKINAKTSFAANVDGSFSGIGKNTESEIVLEPHQTLNLLTETYDSSGGDLTEDLTGSHISCAEPEGEDCGGFAVFSGHSCTNIPSSMMACDHIEQQLISTSQWGREYVLVKSQARGEEYDYARIVALMDDTTISFSPSVPGEVTVNIPDETDEYGRPGMDESYNLILASKTFSGADTSLNSGDFTDFYFREPVVITADKPVMVVHYLTATQMVGYSCMDYDVYDQSGALVHQKMNDGKRCWGDPAMMIVPPVEQLRSEYVFATPGSFGSNYLNVYMKEGVKAKLNGTEITGSEAISGTSYVKSGVTLTDAASGNGDFSRHRLTCSREDGTPAPCGIAVYGWEEYVSYAFPGGLDLKMLK